MKCAACLLLALCATAAQDTVIRDNVNLVVLDASVRDSRGAYVPGLQASNFSVFADGRLQKISNFEAMDAPVTVGLVVDTSGSMARKRSDVVLAGMQFARTSNRHDEFFVVNFNGRVYSGMPRGTPFTDNVSVLRSALYYGKAEGRTALYDAVAFGLKELEAGHREVRTLIVLSDGGDNASKLKLNDVVHLVEASRAIVYTVGLLDPDDPDLNPGALRKLAALTGGEYFSPETPKDLPSVFERISKDIRSRYALSFTPEGEAAHPGTHRLKVVVKGPAGRKLNVRTRTVYSDLP